MSNNRTILDLVNEKTVILDGAMGSLLISQGLEPGIPPEYWNISNPVKIADIHKQYFASGSDAVLTNTFGGSRLKLSAHKHFNRVDKYNIQAVEIAREVCPENGFIAGDIGPSGKFLPPVGKLTEEDLYENFLEQAGVLADVGIDFFYIETMSDIKEAEAAVKAAKKVSNLPIFASMTYKKTKKGYFTIMGNSVKECVTKLEATGIDAIGANCTLPSYEMVELIPSIDTHTNLPIIAKPNAGVPELINGKTVYPTSPADFTKDIELMVQYKARIVGGCCGTNPNYIESISQKLIE